MSRKQGEAMRRAAEAGKEARAQPRRGSAAALLAALAAHPLSEDTLDAIERQVRARRDDPATAPDL